MGTVTLLGPQRLRPTVVHAVDAAGVGSPVAGVTAGWQEREGEDQELAEHLGREVVDLRLHARCEEVFADDPELFAAHRARQDRLRELQRLYRYRLDFAIEPARELLRREGDPELLEPARESALESLRTLDREHLERVAAVNRRFEDELAPGLRPALRRHRDEIARILADAAALTVAGGHVAVLLNRLRLFGIGELAAHLPIFAWSAGAMALSERVVLFHDSPPQGAGNAEVLESGLGLFPKLVVLPHARHRLRLDDAIRVALCARRFAPSRTVPLDEGESLAWEGRRWKARGEGYRCLDPAGVVLEQEAA